jgi:hypothetical protein
VSNLTLGFRGTKWGRQGTAALQTANLPSAVCDTYGAFLRLLVLVRCDKVQGSVYRLYPLSIALQPTGVTRSNTVDTGRWQMARTLLMADWFLGLSP